jgi:hypothetical protein
MNREEANQLKVTQLNDKMFRNHLEDCLAFGKVRKLLRGWLVYDSAGASYSSAYAAKQAMADFTVLITAPCSDTRKTPCVAL